MGISYQKLKSVRQWKATTGVTKEQFESLTLLFAQAYVTVYGRTMEERQADSLTDACLKTPAELLFFLLFSLKNGLTFDSLGFVFGLDGAGANRYRASALPVLKAALESSGAMPARGLATVGEFEEYFKEHTKLIIDGTEQRIQRPGEKGEQEICYSGKKNAIR